MSIPGGLAAGATANLIITIMGSILLSFMLSKERLLWENTGYAIMLLLLLSSFSGTAIAVLKIKRRRMLVCISSCGINFLMLLLTAALFFGGKYEATGVTLAIILSGSISALLLVGNKKEKHIHYQRKNRR